MTARDLRGIEFDWFATDRDGHLGHFSTAGCGLAPPSALADTEREDAIAAALMAQPEIGDALLAADALGDTHEWVSFARRGIYSFDADFHGGPYKLIAAPTKPLTIASLPLGIAQVLVLRLEGFCFDGRRRFSHSELGITEAVAS